LGVIDTIAAGFRTVTRRIWLILLPLALDLMLWRGPRLSIAPLVEKMIAWMQASIASVATTSDAAIPSVYDLNVTADTLRDTIGRMNLFSALAVGRLGFPSIAGMQPIQDSQSVIAIESPWAALGLQALLLAVGLWIASLYLSVLAYPVRGTRVDLSALPRDSLTNWGRLATVFVPLSLILSFALSISLLLGPLLILTGIALLWLLFFLSLVPPAIVLAGDTPWRAIVSSFGIARLNLWPTLALLLLINLLSAGLGVLFMRWLSTNLALGLAAIVANAYVGTALTLALFIFYRDRLARLHQLLAERRSA
jgi:hypothetical protein